MLEQSIGCVINTTAQIVAFILAALRSLCGSIIQLWKRISNNPSEGTSHKSIHYPIISAGKGASFIDQFIIQLLAVERKWLTTVSSTDISFQSLGRWLGSGPTGGSLPSERASEQWGNRRITSFLTVMDLFSFSLKIHTPPLFALTLITIVWSHKNPSPCVAFCCIPQLHSQIMRSFHKALIFSHCIEWSGKAKWHRGWWKSVCVHVQYVCFCQCHRGLSLSPAELKSITLKTAGGDEEESMQSVKLLFFFEPR